MARRKGSEAKEGKKADDVPVVADRRFRSLHSDPRFARFPRKDRTVKVDERFAGMFSDERFQRQKKHGVNKYGQSVKSKAARGKKEDLERYYEKDDADSGAHGSGEEARVSDGGSSVDNSSAGKTNARAGRTSRVLRGDDSAESDAESSSSSHNSSSSSSSDAGGSASASGSPGEEEDVSDSESASSSSSSSSGEELPDVPLTESISVPGAQAVPYEGEMTRRLAIVNVDWSFVRAVDLYVLLSSFIPTGGKLLRVTVYPSDFGLQAMKEEKEKGPVRLWQLEESLGLRKSSLAALNQEEGAAEVDPRVLREYELSKLRYYYAVAEFDSPRSAEVIYTECDGLEIGQSGNVLDVRVVPAEQDFASRQVRDTADSIPGDYTPPDFHTKVLENTRVELTWDVSERDRKSNQLLVGAGRKFDKKNMNEDDLQAYLASSASESEDANSGSSESANDDASKREKAAKLRALLDLDGAGSADSGDSEGQSGDDEEVGGDIEITFTPGLSQLPSAIEKRQHKDDAKKNESAFERTLREKREKRKQERRLKKEEQKAQAAREQQGLESSSASSDNDSAASMAGDDFFTMASDDENDDAPEARRKPVHAKQEKKTQGSKAALRPQRRGETTRAMGGEGDHDEDGDGAKQRARAEMELVMMADDDVLGARSGALDGAGESDDEERAEGRRRRRRGKKKGRKGGAEDFANPAGSAVNVQDDRFSALYTSAKFFPDPTNPQFKKTAGMEKIMEERRRRHGAGDTGAKKRADGGSSGNSSADLKGTVAQLKRRAQEHAARHTSRSFNKRQKSIFK